MTRKMHAISLYSNLARPDAPHDVRAPGGYESWYFDAEDIQRDRQLVVVLWHGLQCHPQYLRRFARYLHFPTRTVPPVPGDYPGAFVALYEGGRVRARRMLQFPPGSCMASPDGGTVTVGTCRMARTDDGIELFAAGGEMVASLLLVPRHKQEPLELRFPSRPLAQGEHRWVFANPLCDVSAEIRCGDERFTFTGPGYHDHSYGTAPLGLDLARWFSGRVLLDDAAYAFRFARPRDRAIGDEMLLVEATRGATTVVPVARASGDWSGQSSWLLEYPRTFALDDVLHLHNPRAIGTSPYNLRLVYDAVCRSGRCGQALCELVYPQRLRAPLLGRMIEMSIDKVALDGSSSRPP